MQSAERLSEVALGSKSVALILEGTFVALIPSGIVTLKEVAVFVLIGLVLLSFIMFPIFISAVMSLTDNG